MAPMWNNTQKQAIEARGRDTIVSAGAGSGKTAVLTERVAQLVLQGHSISNMLVLTFTNAAAAEMKARIRIRLLELQLNKEATLVDSAHIMTFDAFSLSLVRRYHYWFHLESDVGILEESILKLLRKRTMVSIFDRYYEKHDARFLDLIQAYAIRSDDSLRNLVIALDQMTDLKLDKANYYRNYIDTYFSFEYIDRALCVYKDWIDEQLKQVLALINQFDHEVYRDDIQAQVQALILTDEFDLKITSIQAYAFPNIRKYGLDEDQKSQLERIKGRFKQLKSKVAIGSRQDISARYVKTKPYVAIIVELATLLDEELSKLKRHYNRFSFSDIAKMAIQLVSDEALRTELVKEFRFIMIDEYQDTNDLQDRFISQLAQDNVFMVGDVKQSIYRFRNANCRLFTQKYDDYKHGKSGQAIDMNTNYRSRKEVLDAINNLFGQLMTMEIGGVDYYQQHEIEYGQTAYDKNVDPQADYGLKVYRYEDQGTEGSIEREIRIIAQDIITKFNQKRLVYDKDEKKLRDIDYADIAILIDRRSSFKTYARIFEEYGLPLEVQFFDEMRQSDVLNVFENLIRLVAGHGQSDYPQKYRHELASVWRSFLFRYDDQTIFSKLQNLTNQLSDPLFIKVESLAVIKAEVALGTLVRKIALDFDLHHATIHLGDVMIHAGRIEELIHLATGLQAIGMTIGDFVAYFDDAVALDTPLVLDSPKLSTGAIKLMTIHQSKGLEFPVVYYPGLFKQFNLPEDTAATYAHNKYGLILPLYEDEEPYSFFHHLVRDEERKAALSEEMRKLYVALTRTRETMIILMKNPDDGPVPIPPRSMADFLRLAPWLTSAERPLPEKQSHVLRPRPVETIVVDFKQLNLVAVQKTMARASRVLITDREGARYGTRLHDIMARIDYRHPALDDIGDPSIRHRVEAILALAPLQTADRAEIYQEYSFYDSRQDLFGTMDLMLIYDDHIDIVDFKSGSLEPDYYETQLRAYYNYVTTISDLPINLYLVSLTRVEYRRVRLKENL